MDTEAKAAKIHEALQEIGSLIRGLLAGAARKDVVTRHMVGEHLRKVTRTPDTYGSRAVESLSEELGYSDSTLYDCIAVAENWPKVTLDSFLEETTRFGQPLSWTHFVLLTKIPDAASRFALAKECLERLWSVRELKDRIKHLANATVRDHDAVRAGEPIRAALTEGLQGARRALHDLGLFEEALSARLPEAGDSLDEDLVARMLAVLQELRDRSDSTIARLAKATASQPRLRVSVPSTDATARAERESPGDDQDEREEDGVEHSSPTSSGPLW